MATQIACGTTPDVITMSGAYPSEYASRGVLLDLAKVKDQLDTSKFAEGTVDLGKISGKQYTITAGVNAMSMVIDPKVFEAAGVDLPDDETWTWDDYADIAAQITKNSPQGTFGTTPMANDSFLAVWARQHGEDLYTDDGKKLGISEDTAAEWNNMDAGTKIKSDRGMPANTELKAGIAPLLKESQQREAVYQDRLARLDIEPPLPFPAGSSATMAVLNRNNTDVLFGMVSPQDAGQGLHFGGQPEPG